MMEKSLPSCECPVSLWLDLMRQFFAIPSPKNRISFPYLAAVHGMYLKLFEIILPCRGMLPACLPDKHTPQLFVMTGMTK
jgi:hypothetical protein